MRVATRLGCAAVVLFGLIAGSQSSLGADPAKPDAEKKTAAKMKPAAKPVAKPASPATDDGAVVITNDDLERMFGPADVKPPKVETADESKEPGQKGESEEGKAGEGAASPPGANSWDPLKAMEEEKKRAAEQQSKIAAASGTLAAAEANLKNLEERLLATKNPYLARPSLTPDEAKKVEGMDNANRVAMTEKELQDARAQVEKARGALAQAQARTQ